MSMLLKRTRVRRCAAALAVLALVRARRQDYPTRQITIMPLLAAGTGLDVTVRLYAEQLSQSFGKPVVVENKPGSAGLVGIAALKAAPRRRPHADGRDQRGDGDPADGCSSTRPTMRRRTSCRSRST